MESISSGDLSFVWLLMVSGWLAVSAACVQTPSPPPDEERRRRSALESESLQASGRKKRTGVVGRNKRENEERRRRKRRQQQSRRPKGLMDDRAFVYAKHVGGQAHLLLPHPLLILIVNKEKSSSRLYITGKGRRKAKRN